MGTCVADWNIRRGVIGFMVTEKVAIVIPALNEEAAIHQLLAELPQDFAQWVIVVSSVKAAYYMLSTTLRYARTRRTHA